MCVWYELVNSILNLDSMIAIIVRIRNTPITGSFYFVLIAIDFMAINFFFLVKDEGYVFPLSFYFYVISFLGVGWKSARVSATLSE
jgi:hypothetical protein